MSGTYQIAQQTAQGVVLSTHDLTVSLSVLEAVKQAHIQATAAHIGVWGRKIKPAQILAAGDRIEIYLPLIADPKDARRARVNRSLVQQATKENAANRAVNRQMRQQRQKREAKQLQPSSPL